MRLLTALDVSTAIERVLNGAAPGQCESAILDFKDGRDSEEGIAEAVICFANGNGGHIVVGAADRVKGRDAFSGTTMDAEHLRRRILQLTNPPIMVEIEVLEEPARLLVIRVPRGIEVYADQSGRAKRRVGTDCLPLSPAQLATLRDERRGYDWSDEPTDRVVADIQATAMEMAREGLSRFSDQRVELLRLSDADLLRALGVLRTDGFLNRAGELLFCAELPPRDRFVYLYRPTPGGEAQVHDRFVSPLIVAFQRIMERIGARRRETPLTLPDGQQIALQDFPEAAVREGISNALCHRDFRLGEPVLIEHSPDMLLITSPGPLVSGVTLDNIITTPARPRNPALARAARMLGLAEETGRGVDRMIREMVRSGHRPPEFSETDGNVRLALLAGSANTSLARFLAQLPKDEREDTDTVLLLLHMCENRSISIARAASLFQRNVDEAVLVLRRLSVDPPGLIQATRRTAQRSQQNFVLRGEVLRGLGTAVRYNRASTEELDRKVVAHIKEYGRITNRTLQNMLDVGVFRARDHLADLKSRGVIIRISEQRSGPGVEWGPGPKFPKQSRRRAASKNSLARTSPHLPFSETEKK